MRIDVSFLPAYAAAFMLLFARIGTMVMLLPGLGEMSVPVRVRLVIALVLAAVLFPLHRAAYALIIAAELAIAALCWVGAAMLARRIRADAFAFNRAKASAVAGLTLGFLLWQVGFMSIGGEWFGMWQSQQWNGVPSAFRFVMVIVAVLIFLALPDPELEK